jgi:hypothetical protein
MMLDKSRAGEILTRDLSDEETLKRRLIDACPAAENARRHSAWVLAVMTGIQRATTSCLLNGEVLPGAFDAIRVGVRAHYKTVIFGMRDVADGERHISLLENDLEWLLHQIGQKERFGVGQPLRQLEFSDLSGSWRAPPEPSRTFKNFYSVGILPGARRRWYMSHWWELSERRKVPVLE